MKTCSKLYLILLTTIIMIIPFSCKSKKETYSTNEGKVTVEREGEKADITFKSKEGKTMKMTIEKGRLPADWPDELKVIKGGEITFSQTASEGMEGMEGMQQIHIETDTPADEALKYYEDRLRAGGWDIEGSMTMAQMKMLTASKDNKKAMIQVVTEEGKTRIQIILTKEG